jgi:hypothetical protein
MSEVWTIDEILINLFARDLKQIKVLCSKSPSWSLDTKWVRVDRVTEELNLWCKSRKQYFSKEDRAPIDEKSLDLFIEKGWGKEVGCPYDLKKEHRVYKEAKTQLLFFEDLKRAVLDRIIETVENHDIDQLDVTKWRLKAKSVLYWVNSILKGGKSTLNKPLKSLVKKHKRNLLSKQENKGGRPKVDPEGKLLKKIKALKSENIPDKEIPWDIRFTKIAQHMKKNKIDLEYFNKKIPPRIKGREYTKYVGISLDSVKNLTDLTP